MMDSNEVKDKADIVGVFNKHFISAGSVFDNGGANILSGVQSGFRSGHSTITAAIAVANNIINGQEGQGIH